MVPHFKKEEPPFQSATPKALSLTTERYCRDVPATCSLQRDLESTPLRDSKKAVPNLQAQENPLLSHQGKLQYMPAELWVNEHPQPQPSKAPLGGEPDFFWPVCLHIPTFLLLSRQRGDILCPYISFRG